MHDTAELIKSVSVDLDFPRQVPLLWMQQVDASNQYTCHVRGTEKRSFSAVRSNEGLATGRSQSFTIFKVIVHSRLPVLHELAVVVVRERRDKGVTFQPEACMGVSDDRFGTRRNRAELYGELARRDERSDLEHFNEAIFGLVSGDVPDCNIRGCSSDEYAIRLSNSRLCDNGSWIPSVYPVCFAHWAQQRKHRRWPAHKVLRVGASHTVRFDDLHGNWGMMKVDDIYAADKPGTCSAIRKSV